jgi:hypothetical protein
MFDNVSIVVKIDRPTPNPSLYGGEYMLLEVKVLVNE